MAPKPCLDRPDFILSLYIKDDQSLTRHVYTSVTVFEKILSIVHSGWLFTVEPNLQYKDKQGNM